MPSRTPRGRRLQGCGRREGDPRAALLAHMARTGRPKSLAARPHGMARDPGRDGALFAAVVVALYLPAQPALAWGLATAGVAGAEALDGLARWTSTAVV